MVQAPEFVVVSETFPLYAHADLLPDGQARALRFEVVSGNAVFTDAQATELVVLQDPAGWALGSIQSTAGAGEVIEVRISCANLQAVHVRLPVASSDLDDASPDEVSTS